MQKREVVVITGASAGAGRAAVREFARHGANIGLIARGRDGLEAGMPALNTPQFGWSRSRMPRKAQPVPPIYQPEVAGRLIYHAAHHPERREWYASWSVVKAIFGNKLAPGFADHYLAKNDTNLNNTMA